MCGCGMSHNAHILVCGVTRLSVGTRTRTTMFIMYFIRLDNFMFLEKKHEKRKITQNPVLIDKNLSCKLQFIWCWILSTIRVPALHLLSKLISHLTWLTDVSKKKNIILWVYPAVRGAACQAAILWSLENIKGPGELCRRLWGLLKNRATVLFKDGLCVRLLWVVDCTLERVVQVTSLEEDYTQMVWRKCVGGRGMLQGLFWQSWIYTSIKVRGWNRVRWWSQEAYGRKTLILLLHF